MDSRIDLVLKAYSGGARRMVRLLGRGAGRRARCLCTVSVPHLGEERIFPRTAEGGEWGDELLEAPEEIPVQGDCLIVRGLHVTANSLRPFPLVRFPVPSLLESGQSRNPCSD